DRSGEIGICHGETPKNFGCRIEYLNRQAEIFEGDVAVTSGLGGIFPKNILIGTISTVDKKNFGLFASAALKPYIELSHLEYVLVLKKEKNKWPEK
ncbi:MAG TPA: rod shape-determining protein MreC, partial [Spirochaetia bacterium]|nr:rod shape-determining protein MreC [Spirochaetia bacterium]